MGDMSPPPSFTSSDEDVLAAAVCRLLRIGMADKCKIQAIVEMAADLGAAAGEDEAGGEAIGAAVNLAEESDPECHSDSCL
jgi:hypothetical protein